MFGNTCKVGLYLKNDNNIRHNQYSHNHLGDILEVYKIRYINPLKEIILNSTVSFSINCYKLYLEKSSIFKNVILPPYYSIKSILSLCKMFEKI